ncbi:hypothetical protein CUN67_30365 (plasmid) [Pantoea cypripedii]|uniref:Uncharacterized protein n=1 Tax=Pantoea cypripedii TaxID=55209 RepID=A0A6B9GHL6_PANCY|nr:hypothetical protein CUN67_30365 [Pantoea cypripedii]
MVSVAAPLHSFLEVPVALPKAVVVDKAEIVVERKLDNAVAESFFSSLKKERIRKRIYAGWRRQLGA